MLTFHGPLISDYTLSFNGYVDHHRTIITDTKPQIQPAGVSVLHQKKKNPNRKVTGQTTQPPTTATAIRATGTTIQTIGSTSGISGSVLVLDLHLLDEPITKVFDRTQK